MRALIGQSRYLKRADLGENDARAEITETYSHENFLNVWHYGSRAKFGPCKVFLQRYFMP